MEENIFNLDNTFNTEIGRKILALTKAGFKVSDLITDLVLREKIKSQILVAYKKFIENDHSELLKEIDVLEHYFYLGGHLNVIKEEHVRQLRNGFLVFKSHILLLNNNMNGVSKNARITRIMETEFPLGSSAPKSAEILTEKQKKILQKFESKDNLKLAEILELFSDVSERTIRNELASLINLGKITRNGKGNGSFYKLLK